MPMEYDNALRQRKSLLPKITVNTLKIAGAILLTLYFFSTAVIQNGVLHVPSYTPQQLNDLLGRDPEAMLWAGIASMAEITGMVAISIYAYLLVQGVEHTSSMGKYALSVLAFALISEVPYDLAVLGRPWDWSSQNTLWGVFIALVTLWLMKRTQGQGIKTYVFSVLAAVGRPHPLPIRLGVRPHRLGAVPPAPAADGKPHRRGWGEPGLYDRLHGVYPHLPV